MFKYQEQSISSQSGGIVVAFALLLVPMMVLTAFAVDMTRVMTNRIIMQNIADQLVLDILNLRVQEGWTKFSKNRDVCNIGFGSACDKETVKKFYINRAMQTGHILGRSGEVNVDDGINGIIKEVGITDGDYDITKDKAFVEVTQVAQTSR